MSYTQITAHVIDQTLQLTNLPPLASGGVDEIQLTFDFCHLWDGYGKSAVFYRTAAEVYHIPIVDNTATVPHEVTADKGHFFLGVVGVADNTRTTEVLRVDVKEGAITTATAQHKDPTPDIYQQILAAYGLLEARFNNILAGGTPEDGELLDLRVALNGTVYDSAGEAVRVQFGHLAPVIVTHDTSGQCSHTADEIYSHVKAGRHVILAWNGSWYVPLTEAKTNQANFDRSTFNAQGDPIFVSLTIDSAGILTRTGCTLPLIDDSQVGADAWSSKNIVDKLCPAFTESGAIVTCEPVEGYPLTVSADAEATTITRCGKNLLDLSEEKVKAINFINDNSTQSADFWGVEIILPPGTYTRKATTQISATDYIYGAVNDLSKTKYIQSFSTVAGVPTAAKTATFTEWVRLYIYDSSVTIAAGRTKAQAMERFNRYNIQLEVGNTATAYEPYNGGTFDPGETIPALPGINTIFADAGTVTVTGRADPNAINRKTAERLAALEAALVNT